MTALTSSIDLSIPSSFRDDIRTMLRSAVDIDRFRPQIEKKLLVEHRTQKDVVTWLGTRGISLTVGRLKQQCKPWGVSRRGAAADERTVEQVHRRFHTTTEDDATIAKKLSSEGLSITARQIKDLRLQRHWRRKASNDTQIKEQRAGALEIVQQDRLIVLTRTCDRPDCVN
jgi:hypothetical protein